MSKLGRLWLLGLCLLTACQTNDWPTTPETNGEHIAFKIQYDDRFENDSVALSKTETGTYLNTKYDHVELIVSNPNGTVVEGLKGLYDSVTSEVRISGLQAGEY